jgi:putative transposase
MLLFWNHPMPHKYTQLYVHVVWSTWNRLPLINEHIESELYSAIVKKCRQLECKPIAINGTEDHIHLLVSLHPKISTSRLVKDIKGSSSHLITHEIAPNEFFKWQGGFGVFSVSKGDLQKVRAYIKNQKNHHHEGGLLQAWEMTINE